MTHTFFLVLSHITWCDQYTKYLLQEASQLFSFDFGGGGSKSSEIKKKPKKGAPYQVPEDRAIGRPHMMGWLDLLGDEELLGGDGDGEAGDEVEKEETLEADKWEEVKV